METATETETEAVAPSHLKVTLEDAIAVTTMAAVEFYEMALGTYRQFGHVPSLRSAQATIDYIDNAANWMAHRRALRSLDQSIVDMLLGKIGEFRSEVNELVAAEKAEDERVAKVRAESEALVK